MKLVNHLDPDLFWGGPKDDAKTDLPKEHKGGVSFDYWTSNPWFANAPRDAARGGNHEDGVQGTADAKVGTTTGVEYAGASGQTFALASPIKTYDGGQDDQYFDDTSTCCGDDYDFAQSEPDASDYEDV